jgi:hypothetical protein
MKKHIMLSMSIVGLLAAAAFAGSLNPPAGPTAGTMKTLTDVEPRTAIRQANIPLTISAAGSYYLAENVTFSGTGTAACINVTADDVTIDLNGFTITGSGGGRGISLVGRSNVEVSNGTIRNFDFGIYNNSASGHSTQVLGVRFFGCGFSSVFLVHGNCRVENCVIANGCTAATGSAYGIRVGANSTVCGNRIYKNGGAASNNFIGISAEGNSVVSRNTVFANGVGTAGSELYGIWTASGALISDNSVYDNGDTAVGATIYSIAAGAGSTLVDNRSYSNGTSAGNASTSDLFVYGIYTSDGCVLKGNSCYLNGGNSAVRSVYGIQTGFGCTIADNTASQNGNLAASNVYGIAAGYGSSVTGNSAYSNGTGATGTHFGIHLTGHNAVNNNTAVGNAGTNMNTVGTCSYGINRPQLP